jgi:Flp pilus assembly protein TadG
MQRPKRLRSDCRGHAVIEVALLSPWIFFLLMGTFDMGFYAHAIIATQNAARAAAAYTSRHPSKAADSAGACEYAKTELKTMSNVRSLATCNSSPLIVTASAVTGTDGSPASSVSVTYRTNTLIPIPGLAGQFNITRTVQMMVK